MANFLQRFALLSGQQLFGLMLGMAAIIAVLVGAWIWGQTPDYRVLYSNLSDRDGGTIIAALQQMNIPYKFAEGGGAILVPSTNVHEARLRLASQGLPRGGQSVGFELMENPKLGMSQFQEQINYQRALEGELVRSIQTLTAVQGARVHLALAKPSVFLRDQSKPSASVLLTLSAGKNLEAGQVSAIVHLVSSSIPNLTAKEVTVIDQYGNLLNSPSDGMASLGLDPSQLKYLHEVEKSYVKRIEAIITPIVGPNNVRAQVTADLDFSQIENTAEIYKPNQANTDKAIRSEQNTQSQNTLGAAAGGVPGALSNQPPTPAIAPITGAGGARTAPAAGPASGNSQRETTVNYEVDRTIRHTKQPVGTIKRLSAAVVVNYKKIKEGRKVTEKALTEAEMKQVNDLVREAMGYNRDRGDTVNVVNSSFTQDEPEVIPETPWWKSPNTIALAKEIGKLLLIAGLALYLVLGVLKPLLKKLAEPAPALLSGHIVNEGGALPPPNYEQNLMMAKQLARQDPKLIAGVVKDWVAGS